MEIEEEVLVENVGLNIGKTGEKKILAYFMLKLQDTKIDKVSGLKK